MLRCMSLIVILGLLKLALPAVADEDDVASALDAFHSAASRADQESYFALMTDDVVFLGTDGTERWQGQEFRDFVSGHFSRDEGWTYVPIQRHIDIAAGGRWALFDELLRHERLGQCRGSGVLVSEAGRWKIAQYNLGVPIPNELVDQVAAEIQQLSGATGQGDRGITEAAAAVLTPPESVDPAPPERTENCPKRHKTNRRAGC